MTSAINLKNNPLLSDFQKYVSDMVKERGFEDETVPEIFMLFLEECGEFSKAARKTQNIKVDKKARSCDLSDEAADVFMYLLDICNKFGIDLEEAFRRKEEKNKKRKWE